MNNNPFGQFQLGGGSTKFVDFSKVKTATQAAQERMAQKAAEQPKQEENKQSNDDVAKEIGNNFLRDLGVMAYTTSVGFKKGEDGKMTPTLMAPAFEVDRLNGNNGTTKVKEEVEEKVEEPAQEEPKEEDAEYVEYTYKPGDTFGQVVRDLGLETDAGLWGSNGDVNYYTQQLVEQGALDERGNVPIGTTIRLKKRK